MITAAVIMVVIISLLLLLDHIFTLQNFCCHFYSPATIISPWVIVSLLTPLLCWYEDPSWSGLCLPPHSLILLPTFLSMIRLPWTSFIFSNVLCYFPAEGLCKCCFSLWNNSPHIFTSTLPLHFSTHSLTKYPHRILVLRLNFAFYLII